MILSLEKSILAKYVQDQLRHFFPDDVQGTSINKHIDEVLGKVEHCFSAVHDRYFRNKSQTFFNHLNSDQYAMFLYILSNTLHKHEEDPRLCEKVFYLNKALNGIDVFYSVELPGIFLFCHPVGTVLGRAQYADNFIVYQNCTIGSNHEVDYPIIGKQVALYKGASILGKCTIGDNCKISAHSLVMDFDLEPNKIYIGTPDNHRIKECKHHDKIWDPKYE
jgi:serine O-acetyltransferase